jgi:hypothetical protein
MTSNANDVSEGVVELVAEACCNDILARDVADKQCTPAFEDCDAETQTFWRHIARAAIATLSPPASPQGVELLLLLDVEKAARKLPRETPAAGGCSTVHSFAIEAAHVWANDAALDALDQHRAALSALPLSGDPI